MWANTIAERLGTTRSTIQRWRDVDVRFDVYGADKWAVRLGKHPSQIWPEWFDLPECTYRQRQRIMKGTGLA
jgi:hypothetical protein